MSTLTDIGITVSPAGKYWRIDTKRFSGEQLLDERYAGTRARKWEALADALTPTVWPTGGQSAPIGVKYIKVDDQSMTPQEAVKLIQEGAAEPRNDRTLRQKYANNLAVRWGVAPTPIPDRVSRPRIMGRRVKL